MLTNLTNHSPHAIWISSVCSFFVIVREKCVAGLGARTNFFFFLNEKLLCVRRRDRYLDTNPANSVQWKTCLRNMANTYYSLFALRPYFVISSWFRRCSQIVYSGLKGKNGVMWLRQGILHSRGLEDRLAHSYEATGAVTSLVYILCSKCYFCHVYKVLSFVGFSISI